MDFIPYYNTTRLKEDPADFQRQCTQYLGQVRCAENYTLGCLHGVVRAVSLLGLRGALSDYEEVCDPTSDKYQVYVRNIACINEAGPTLHRCVRTAFAAFKTIILEVPRKEKINYGCCEYHDLVTCSEEALKETCDRQEVLKYYAGIMEHTFGELLQLVCGPFTRGSAACKTIPPLPPVDPNALEDVNIVEPLAKLVQSLG